MAQSMAPLAKVAFDDSQTIELLKKQLDALKARARSAEADHSVAASSNHVLRMEIQHLRKLLQTLCSSLELRGIEVPGYEDAVAYLMEEKLINPPNPAPKEGDDLTLTWSDDTNKIFKL